MRFIQLFLVSFAATVLAYPAVKESARAPSNSLEYCDGEVDCGYKNKARAASNSLEWCDDEADC
jgi:hypothetical protein